MKILYCFLIHMEGIEQYFPLVGFVMLPHTVGSSTLGANSWKHLHVAPDSQFQGCR